MNKQNLSTLPVTAEAPIESDYQVLWTNPTRSRRLIVLTSLDSDCMSLTRRICRLANETNSTVQLLGLCQDPNEELTLRRQLVTASALIREAKVCVEANVEVGSDWLAIVKKNYQEGDTIVCISDQLVGIRRRPLSHILESTFKAPIYILSDTSPTQSRSKLGSRIIAWSGSIGIIIGFFLLQARVIQVATGGFQTLLLIMLLVPEIWLVKAWNSIFF